MVIRSNLALNPVLILCGVIASYLLIIMIPKKEHLKQVERFHELLETIDKQIEEKGKDAGFELLQKYFELTSKVWPMVDDCIEQIKDRLDKFERF